MMPIKLERFIRWGLILILAVMPFHAFLSVWAGHLFGHQAVFQAWKEFVLATLTIVAGALVLIDRARLNRLKQPWVYATGMFALVALIVTFITRPGLHSAIFGLKTDFEFLLAALLATLVASKAWLKIIIRTVFIGAAVVSGFDIIQIFLLPPGFLTHFGYGPDTILPYQHIAAGTNALRFPATLGGPNQLGTYLILPICLAITQLKQRRLRPWITFLLIACTISLFATHSRSAWIGSILAVAITIFALIPRKARKPFLATGFAALIVAAFAFPYVLAHGGQAQYLLLHSSVANHDQANLSDSQHLTSLKTGINDVEHSPFGHGLGTAGPATFHAGSTNIIEDYYLQLSYETGALGLLAFLIVLILVLYLLAGRQPTPLQTASLAAVSGISFVCLVLPAWTDSSTALIVWISAGAVIGTLPRRNHVQTT